MASNNPLSSMNLAELESLKFIVDGTKHYKSPIVKAVDDEIKKRVDGINDALTNWIAGQSQPPPPPPPIG